MSSLSKLMVKKRTCHKKEYLWCNNTSTWTFLKFPISKSRSLTQRSLIQIRFSKWILKETWKVLWRSWLKRTKTEMMKKRSRSLTNSKFCKWERSIWWLSRRILQSWVKYLNLSNTTTKGTSVNHNKKEYTADRIPFSQLNLRSRSLRSFKTLWTRFRKIKRQNKHPL